MQVIFTESDARPIQSISWIFWYWCYSLHTLRYSLSLVCGILLSFLMFLSLEAGYSSLYYSLIPPPGNKICLSWQLVQFAGSSDTAGECRCEGGAPHTGPWSHQHNYRCAAIVVTHQAVPPCDSTSFTKSLGSGSFEARILTGTHKYILLL
jgi:hypothetical protein